MIHLALLLLPTQSDTVRLGEKLCASCAIRVESVAALGESNGSGMLTTNQVAVSRDARGRYLVSSTPSQLAVFSAQGSFLRTVGRSGGGPGEYRRIWRIGTTSSAIYLYDDVARRRTRLSLGFEVVATTPITEVPFSVALRTDGSGVVSSVVPTRELAGYLLHNVDENGARGASHHLSSLPYREDLRDLFERSLSVSADEDFFWSAHRREYAMERCRFVSLACTVFLRPADWFPPPALSPWGLRMGSSPPPPYLRGVSEDGSGTVWTIAWVADPRWRSAIRLVTRDEYHIHDLLRYFDTIVERIDLKSGNVVARQRFDDVFMGFAAPGEVWSYREDEDGLGRIEVGRLMVEQVSTTRRH